MEVIYFDHSEQRAAQDKFKIYIGKNGERIVIMSNY
jgi:hypothetical protein